MSWKARVVEPVNNVLRRFGATLDPWPLFDGDHRRSLLLRGLETDLVLDVGANIGQYGKTLRRYGYRNAIVSFEPMGRAYHALRHVAERDGRWTALNTAVGAEDTVMTLHIAGNQDSKSSSLLPMLGRHVDASPSSATIGSEDVPVRRMDDLVDMHGFDVTSRTFMKVDTQGFEREVLLGAAGVLKEIGGVELELSLVPLYEGQTLLPGMIALMRDAGFSLASLATGFFDKASGELLQADGIFLRTP